jgi:hypothetical protein
MARVSFHRRFISHSANAVAVEATLPFVPLRVTEPCSGPHNIRTSFNLINYLLSLHLNPEDGSRTFLQKIDDLPDYTPVNFQKMIIHSHRDGNINSKNHVKLEE